MNLKENTWLNALAITAVEFAAIVGLGLFFYCLDVLK